MTGPEQLQTLGTNEEKECNDMHLQQWTTALYCSDTLVAEHFSTRHIIVQCGLGSHLEFLCMCICMIVYMHICMYVYVSRNSINYM